MHLLEGFSIDVCLFGTKYTYCMLSLHMTHANNNMYEWLDISTLLFCYVLPKVNTNWKRKCLSSAFHDRFSKFPASFSTIVDSVKLIRLITKHLCSISSEPPLYARYYLLKTGVGMQRNFSSAQEGLSWFQWTECETGTFNSRQIYLYTNTHKEYCTNYLTNLGMRMRAAWDFGSWFSALSRKQRTISHLERAA